MILVFNKKDLYTPDQRARIMEVLRQERLPHVIGADDIVMTAADPLEREVIFENADGSTRTEWRKPKPDVEQLKIRILEVLDREGKALIALNASLYAADTSDRLASVKVRLRDKHANRAIWTFVVAKAIAVATNPVPILDVGGGLIIDTTMVVTLGDIYGLPMSRRNASGLIREILMSAGWVTLGEWITHLVANAMKATSFGAATVVTALPQGLAAGYGSYIVGTSRQVLPRARCIVGRCRPEERRAAHSGKRRERIRTGEVARRGHAEDPRGRKQVIRIAVVGSASTGKSAVANAVFGTAFPVDARSGSTREVRRALVRDLEVIDAPPDTAPEADAYLMVCDKDLTATEFRYLRDLRRRKRPIAIVLNKADTYDAAQLSALAPPYPRKSWRLPSSGEGHRLRSRSGAHRTSGTQRRQDLGAWSARRRLT